MKEVDRKSRSVKIGILEWIERSPKRISIITKMKQPMTVKQIAKTANIYIRSCSDVLQEFKKHGLVVCLNEQAGRSRVYGLTSRGQNSRKRLRIKHGLPIEPYFFPDIDWNLYGELCFSHRSAVVLAMKKPMRPADIRRQARSMIPGLKLSANNTRDVIKWLASKGLVRAVRVPKKAHPLYELTETGKEVQRLLNRL